VAGAYPEYPVTAAGRECETLTIVRLTDHEMAAFRAADERNPGVARLYELIVEHAKDEGGVVERLWRLHMGRLFGAPLMMTLDDCARELDLSRSDVEHIFQRSRRVVLARWEQTPEYRQFSGNQR